MSRLAPAIQRLLDLPEGERRIGPFVLERMLGRGGFAPVLCAREVYGGTALRAVAVKLFPLEGPDAVRARVIAEARALCRVEHPNVVRFYALPIDEARGVMGLAMELAQGTSLCDRLAERGRLEVAEAREVGVAIAAALAAVHRAGLVHRDVKPANVVEAAGVYKLIDFGIAAADELAPRSRRAGGAMTLRDLPLDSIGRRMSSLDAGVSTTAPTSAPASTGADEEATASFGIASGTVGYIDPAIVGEGAKATAASDLYALGVTLFECLTGRLPAADLTTGRLRGEVLDGRAAPQRLRDVAPDVPEALAALVDALVSPVRAERPASAEEVVRALSQREALPAAPAPARPAAPARRMLLPALAVALVGIAGAAVAVRVLDGGAPAPAAGASKPLALATAPPGASSLAPASSASPQGASSVVLPVAPSASAVPGASASAVSSTSALAASSASAPATFSVSAPVASSASAPVAPSAALVPSSSALPVASSGAPSPASRPPGIVRSFSVPAGHTPAGAWLPAFSLRRDSGDEGLAWLAAGERCRDQGLSLCTEAQWSRACEADPGLAATETWTASADGERGFAVRGGATCDDRRIAASAEVSATRAGMCCARAIALRGRDGAGIDLAPLHRLLLAFEAANREGGGVLGALLADPVRFFKDPAMPRRKVVATIDGALARAPDFWMLLDACDIAFEAPSWSADCRKVARESGKITLVLTRIAWSEPSGITAIHDLKVMRPFSAP